MSIGQLCGLGVLAAALAMILKVMGTKVAPAVPLAGGLALAFFALYRYREPIAAMLALAEEAGIRSSLEAVLKMMAVGCLAGFSADICRDMGEATLAARVEMCGRAEILLLCLPFLLELIRLALGLVP
ncbi:MAG: hypothetical protein IJY20_03800 [Clostridia bacterium]|nr:hypothetical protein [Clostridia bacterium]